MLLKISDKLGPLGPIFVFYILCIYGFFVNRVFLSLYHWENTFQLEQFFSIFIVGARTDTIILSLCLVIPTILLLINNNPQRAFLRLLITSYFSMLILVFLLNEIATWPFMEEFSSRPNQLSFQHLTHPKEIFFMIWADYKWLMLITVTLLILIFRASFYFFNACIENIEQWKISRRIIISPVILFLLLLGARSSLGEATANPGIAAFSNNFITNQIALNASYSLSHAFYRIQTESMRARDLYGDMPKEEVIQRVRKYMDANENSFLDKTSTYHVTKSVLKSEKPKNLVIIVVEGLSAKYVGFLNGGKLTPNLDELSKESIVFDNLYSIGTRTDRGVQAMASGFPPSSGSSSILRMDGAQQNFFTITNMLKPLGYSTSFLYGGEKHFDNMASFFLGNGVDIAVGEEAYANPIFRGTWGVSDEDTLNKALEIYQTQSESPFVSFVLTLSNHRPHDFPQGKIELVNDNMASVENTVKYTDYALGEFFKKARQEDYYKDTIFLITADHPYKVAGNTEVPVKEFWIPGMIINSGLQPQRVNTLASQLDLLPTVSHLLGHDFKHPMIGKNLLNPVPLEKQSNIMILHDTFIFRTSDKAAVYRPYKPAVAYQLLNGNWIENQDMLEHIKDGLAHILFPSVSFEENLYKSRP